MVNVFLRDAKRTDTERREGSEEDHLKKEAETGETKPPAKERAEPPEAKEARKKSPCSLQTESNPA